MVVWLIAGVWLGSLASFVALRLKATKNPPKATFLTRFGAPAQVRDAGASARPGQRRTA
jgi:hypothetical protein